MRGLVVMFSVLACSGATDLEHRIDALAESSPSVQRAFAGIHVVELATGKVVYRRNEDKLFLPASNMKVLTSAVALMRLTPDYRFTTRITAEASGDLVLSGSGDPSMSGRSFPYQKDAPKLPPLQAIEALADQVVAAGVQKISGDIVGDDRLYPWAPYAPSWTQDDALREFGAPVSALSVNDNIVTLSIRPGSRPGEPAEVTLDPPLEYYAINNRIVTVAGGGEARVRISRQPGSRQLMLWGSLPEKTSVREETAIDDPALYAAYALHDALTRRGVSIAGRPVARHRAVTEDYDPPAGPALATRTSPTLDQLLQMMDKTSQNLYAELLLRETGRVARHTGTREAGLDELAALLNEAGASPGESRLEDGSGLSRATLVTPHLMTRLLAYMQNSKYHDPWLTLWPIGGEDGTLQHRLCCMTDGHGIRAKTGSLSRALTLSGYADSKSRGRLAFSILVNDFSAPQSEVRAWIDKIAAALLE